MNDNSNNCMICGEKLDYLDISTIAKCNNCGKEEAANIICSKGHYLCDECHGKGAYDFVKAFTLKTRIKDPIEIAEKLFTVTQKIPMLGCENALIITSAIMGSIRNAKLYDITDDMIIEALQRTKKQSIGGYCGLTGICGVAVGVGACFSVILGAGCPKNRETSLTMHAVARVIDAIANQAGPCCCKNFVRLSIDAASNSFNEIFGFNLPINKRVKTCNYTEKHPHGCRKSLCTYY